MDFFFTLLQNNHGEVDIINMLKRFQWNPAYLSIAELSKKKIIIIQSQAEQILENHQRPVN